MPGRWLTIEVHLVAGGGLELDAPPGRVLLVGPMTTFEELAEAIDVAFARWDRGHLHEFTLPDGQLVGDAATADDAPVTDEAGLLVADALAPGQAFLYLFDFGEDWEHHCLVVDDDADPAALLGELPSHPVIIDGWGWIPDQYGRQAREDDGETLADVWPLLDEVSDLTAPGAIDADDAVYVTPHGGAIDADDTAVPGQDAHLRLRGAVVRNDGAAAVRVLTDEPEGWRLLQLAGDGLLLALHQGVTEAESLVVDCIRRLAGRGWPGDAELAAQLEHASGEGPTPMLRTVPVDLSELAGVLDADPSQGSAWLNVRTGELVPLWDETDDDLDLDDGVEVMPRGSSAAYRDMVEFADGLADRALADLLHEAIRGRGAFRQFRDIVFSEETLGRRWRAFAEERERGRARSWLAANGYRPRIQR